MDNKFIYNLKIDDYFKQLIPPLSKEELMQLEKNILRDGCREPICIWNNTILDGHNRYEICTRKKIPFMVTRIFFKQREEAVAWICANQLGRRSITEETRKYLIGKRYEMEKIIGAHNATGINQHTKKEVGARMLPEPQSEETFGRTRERLGKEYNISHATVLKYGRYTSTLDALSEEIPALVHKIITGELKISHESVIEMSHLSSQDVKHLNQLLTSDTSKFTEYLRKALSKKQNYSDKNPIPIGSVKNMPAYDPDAEISSLAFTVPSWVRSIERAKAATNLSEITDTAKKKIVKELTGLIEIINSMLAAIKEEV